MARAVLACAVLAACALALAAAAGVPTVSPPAETDAAVVQVHFLSTGAALLRTKRGSVFRSSKDALVLAPLAAKLDGAVRYLQASAAAPDTVFFVGASTKHFITSDGAETLVRVQGLACKLVRAGDASDVWAEGAVRFHPTDSARLLALCQEEASSGGNGPQTSLYASRDRGATWSFVAKGVYAFDWEQAAVPTASPDSVLVSALPGYRRYSPFGAWDSSVSLMRFTLGAAGNVTLVPRGHTFVALPGDGVASSGFIVAAQVSDNAGDASSVHLQISRDGVLFKQGLLPTALDEHGYTILDSSEGAIFLHVDHDDSFLSRAGNVYLSGRDGAGYSLSLRNNYRLGNGLCHFEKIEGLAGVYIANVLVNGALQTRITFDKGRSWAPIPPPEGLDAVCRLADGCSLHLAGREGPGASPVYSVANAPGLILASGNLGTELIEDDPSLLVLWFSRDAGVSWEKVDTGNWLYEFGDHGAIMVAVERAKTKTLIYSTDEGKTWQSFEFAKSELTVTRIVTEANAVSRRFFLYGVDVKQDEQGDLLRETGAVVLVDFAPVFSRQCAGSDTPDVANSDYETWTPTDGVFPCLLGANTTYVRRRRAADCFVGEPVLRKYDTTVCACTVHDFECDYGFRLSEGAAFSCEAIPGVDVPEIPADCAPGERYTEVNGYRLVVGDQCQGGANYLGAQHWCPNPMPPLVNHVGGIVAAVLIVLLLIGLGVVSFWKRKSIVAFVERARQRTRVARGVKYHGLANEDEDARLMDDDYGIAEGIDSDPDVIDTNAAFQLPHEAVDEAHVSVPASASADGRAAASSSEQRPSGDDNAV